MINVIVTENGRELKAYSITIRRRLPELSNDLTDLIISGEPNGFAFSPSRYTYHNVTVATTANAITFQPSAVAGLITVDGEFVTSGTTSNRILLYEIGVPRSVSVVVKESGKLPKTYVINVARRGSAPSNDLTSLEISGAPMGFVFSPGEYAYPNITVATTVNAITVKPAAISGVITVDGERVTSGTTSNLILLTEIGVPKTIEVAVEEEGRTPKVYTLTVTRRAREMSNNLSSLVISGDPVGFHFSSDTYVYPNITVATTSNSITLTPTAASGIITVDGVRVTSGTSSNQIFLYEIGVSRTVEVIVAEDGKTPWVYSVTVSRRYPTQSEDLMWLEMSGSPTGFAFSPSVYYYPDISVAPTCLCLSKHIGRGHNIHDNTKTCRRGRCDNR
jgi:hypothetical protein